MSLDEIIPFFERELDIPHENVYTLFAEIDKNGDAKITREELFDFFEENIVHCNNKVKPKELQLQM